MSSTLEGQASYGERPLWRPERPRIRPWQLLVRWLCAAAALLIAAQLMPGVSVEGFAGGVVVVLLITILNAVLAPLLAALRLPYTALVGFVLVLFLDAWLLQIAAGIAPGAISVASFGSALLAVLVSSGDRRRADRLLRRERRRRFCTTRRGASCAPLRRAGADGCPGGAVPRDRRARGSGPSPIDARWQRARDGSVGGRRNTPDARVGDGFFVPDRLEPGRHPPRLERRHPSLPLGRERDRDGDDVLRSRTRAPRSSGAARTVTGCSLGAAPAAGTSFSGDADHQILTVSRIEAEKRANPGYRAFFANGFNVTRSLVLFFWEVMLEWTAAIRAIRRDVRPRGHRGGRYPLLRATVLVIRDLIVFGVLSRHDERPSRRLRDLLEL